MMQDYGSFWWQYVTGPATFVRDVVDELTKNRGVVMELPAKVPWEADYRTVVAERLHLDPATRGLGIVELDGSVAPDESLLSIVMDNDRLGYRRGRMSLPSYLESRKALEGQLVWVRNIPTDDSSWLGFIREWHPDACRDGVVLLESRHHMASSAHAVRYTEYVTEHSARLMCDVMTDNGIYARVTDDRRRYAASVLAKLCEGDVELSAALVQTYAPAQDEPTDALRRIVRPQSRMTARAGTLLWEAQLESLFPIVEHDRIEIVESHRSRLEEIVGAGLVDSFGEHVKSYLDIEIGTLAWVVSPKSPRHLHLILEDPGEREHIELLRDCRNMLSHRTPIPEEKVCLLIDRQGWRPDGRKYL